jgi:hypothetical protein
MLNIQWLSTTSRSKVLLQLEIEIRNNIIEEDNGKAEEGLTNMIGSLQETAATKLQTNRL